MTFHILHVDDEPDIRKITELSLGLNPDIVTRGCASGLDAIAVATEWLPDVILCDVMMPLMDGPTMLARLRAQPETANIPIIFMTARAQATELDLLKSLGAVAVISKPFDPMTLAATVLDLLQSARVETLRALAATGKRRDGAAAKETSSNEEDKPLPTPTADAA
ncbi:MULTISPECIES: response regulator [Rhodomicrobium]|uniref:response regulator n=1 Tax=Rhodomicrobium TaxID=1068 RepID=UPI000B4BDB53